jgi:pre-mRNA splicing factor component
VCCCASLQLTSTRVPCWNVQAQEEEARAAELKRRSQVLQRGLPRPALPGDAPAGPAPGADGPGLPPRERAERLLAQELAALLAHDSAKYPLKVGMSALVPVQAGHTSTSSRLVSQRNHGSPGVVPSIHCNS